MWRLVLVVPLVLPLVTGCAAARVAPERPLIEQPIVQVGAEVLRAAAVEVPPEKLGSEELSSLVTRMVAAMRKAPGVGLAAPQLGVPWRVFVLEDREELISSLSPTERQERERVAFPVRVVVNPVVTPVGEEKVTFFEGCLSVAGFAGLVPRHREVEVTGTDERGIPVRWRVRGWPARILQHEVDHLDGTLYVDRMHTRSFGTLPQVKQRFAGRPISEVLAAFGLRP